MELQPKKIIDICTPHYNQWKQKAYDALTEQERKQSLDKAFFWLELQNNLLILWTIENTHKEDPVVQKHVLTARENINKKIAQYASELLNDN